MSLAIWDKTKPVNGKNLLLFCSKYIKAAADLPGGMKSYPFSPEEHTRIEALLKRATLEYDPKAVHMTNLDNIQ